MNPDNKRRIVFDTNALASAAILPDSVSGRALAWGVRHFQLVLSEATLEELVAVLHRRKIARYFEGDALVDFLTMLARISEFVTPTQRIDACRDPKDNQFLEVAVAAHAVILVTGDQDLLALHPFQEIDIVSAGALARRYADFAAGPVD
jgi:putative PIN family toxin of toxin-antitoxin system